MAGAGKKTFTAGETLTASDVNTYLMEQSVMVFGGTAARSSAIPTPSEGMTSYRTDTQQIESYDGAEWRGMSGLQLVKKQTIGSAVSSVTVTGAFSATYENYLIQISGGACSTSTLLSLKLGATTTNYYGQFIYSSWNNTVTVDATTTGIHWLYTGSASGDGLSMSATILSPQLAKTTRISAPSTGAFSTYVGSFNGMLADTTQYTSFIVAPNAGTLTGGTIYVYGYGT